MTARSQLTTTHRHFLTTIRRDLDAAAKLLARSSDPTLQPWAFDLAGRINGLVEGILRDSDDAGGERFQFLEVVRESGGDRHYIGDVAVHAGDFIRAHIAGEWRDGRYEAQWRNGRIDRAWFYWGKNGLTELTECTPVDVVDS